MEEKKIKKIEDKYECDICGKMFTRKWSIKLHKNNSCCGISNNEKIFQCKKCGKTHHNSSNLRRHTCYNTKGNILQCDLCKTWRKHSVNVQETGDRKLTCQRCNTVTVICYLQKINISTDSSFDYTKISFLVQSCDDQNKAKESFADEREWLFICEKLLSDMP